MLDFKTLVLQTSIFEGFRANKYLDAVGVPTIGYGFTASCFDDGQVPNTISRGVADDMLDKILLQYKQIVSQYLDSCPHLTQIQRSALLLPLTDFTYNCGYANLRKLTDYENRNYKEICEKIVLYNKAGGKVLKALQVRRDWELKEIKKAYKELMRDAPTEKIYNIKDVQILLNKLGHNLVIDGIAGKATCKAIITELNARR